MENGGELLLLLMLGIHRSDEKYRRKTNRCDYETDGYSERDMHD